MVADKSGVNIAGVAEGRVRWRGSTTGNSNRLPCKGASLRASVGGHCGDLKMRLDEMASVAKKESLAELELNECSG